MCYTTAGKNGYSLTAEPAETAFRRAATGTFRIDRGDCYGIMAVAMMRYGENISFSKREIER